jgi:hypothetical protein
MKKLMLGFLALTLAVWVVAGTQAYAQQSGSQQQGQTDQGQMGQQNQGSSSNTGQMSGNVSSNGKNFTSDSTNKSYKVDNPDSLKGHEGQHVALIVHVDPDTGVIHVMQVEAPPQ